MHPLDPWLPAACVARKKPISMFDVPPRSIAAVRAGGAVAQSAYDYELGLGAKPMIGGAAPPIEEFNQPTESPLGGGGVTLEGLLNGANGVANPVRTGDNFFGAAMGTNPGASSGVTKFRVNGQVFNTREEAQAYATANTTGGTEYGGFTKAPGYDFRLKQGQDSIEASAAARGGLYSGAALKASQQYGQDYATSEYDNYMNRLAGRADTGMAAAQMSGAASQQAASGVSNALGNIGDAQAAGAVGVGNAITGGIQNALGSWAYMKNINQQPQYGGGR